MEGAGWHRNPALPQAVLELALPWAPAVPLPAPGSLRWRATSSCGRAPFGTNVQKGAAAVVQNSPAESIRSGQRTSTRGSSSTRLSKRRWSLRLVWSVGIQHRPLPALWDRDSDGPTRCQLLPCWACIPRGRSSIRAPSSNAARGVRPGAWGHREEGSVCGSEGQCSSAACGAGPVPGTRFWPEWPLTANWVLQNCGRMCEAASNTMCRCSAARERLAAAKP